MNIPVFDALTGDLRYIFKLNIEGNYFRILLYVKPKVNVTESFREIEVWLINMGWQNRQSRTGGVKCKTCLADRALLDALDAYPADELPSYIQRLV